MDDSHDLEPFGYPPADPSSLTLLDMIMTDAASTSTYIEELPSEATEQAI